MFVLTYQNPDEQNATVVVAVSDDARALESAALRHLTDRGGDTFSLAWRNRRGSGRVGLIREDGSDMCDFYEIAPVQVV